MRLRLAPEAELRNAGSALFVSEISQDEEHLLAELSESERNSTRTQRSPVREINFLFRRYQPNTEVQVRR